MGDTLNWNSVGYIYTVNSRLVAASSNAPPTHWADSPAVMTRRSKARGGVTFGACRTGPNTRSTWTVEEERSSLT